MTLVLPTHGAGTDILAKATALHAVRALALFKNVPLEPERDSHIAQCALRWLSPSELKQFAERKPARVAAEAVQGSAISVPTEGDFVVDGFQLPCALLDRFRRLDVDDVARPKSHLDFRPKFGRVWVQTKRIKNGALGGGGFGASVIADCPFPFGGPESRIARFRAQFCRAHAEAGADTLNAGTDGWGERKGTAIEINMHRALLFVGKLKEHIAAIPDRIFPFPKGIVGHLKPVDIGAERLQQPEIDERAIGGKRRVGVPTTQRPAALAWRSPSSEWP